MAGLLRPVGPLPRRRYWRRRTGLLLAALTVVGLVVAPRLDAAPPAPASAAAGERSGPTAARAAERASGGPAPACAPGDLRLGLVREGRRGEGWVFAVQLRTTGTAACVVDVTRDVDFTVTGGDERVHRASACELEPRREVLEPGAPARAFWLRWDGRVSADGGCSAGGEPAPPGFYVARARHGPATDTAVVEVPAA